LSSLLYSYVVSFRKTQKRTWRWATKCGWMTRIGRCWWRQLLRSRTIWRDCGKYFCSCDISWNWLQCVIFLCMQSSPLPKLRMYVLSKKKTSNVCSVALLHMKTGPLFQGDVGPV
jgi:hypothetical protein